MRKIAALACVGLICCLAWPAAGGPKEKGTVLDIYDPAEKRDPLVYQEEPGDDLTRGMTQELHRVLKDAEKEEARQRQERSERDYDKSRQERRSKSKRLRED